MSNRALHKTLTSQSEQTIWKSMWTLAIRNLWLTWARWYNALCTSLYTKCWVIYYNSIYNDSFYRTAFHTRPIVVKITACLYIKQNGSQTRQIKDWVAHMTLILISTKAPSNTVCTTTLCTVATNTSTVARWTNCLAHYSNSSNSFTLTTSERTHSHIWQHSSLLGSSHQQWPDEQLLQFTLSREAWQRR